MSAERILLTIITIALAYMLAAVLAGRWVRRMRRAHKYGRMDEFK